MAERLFERLAEAASRRSFLRTMSTASAAFALGLMGIQGSEASGKPCTDGLFKLHCCCLAKNPSTCAYEFCGCEWSWPCIEVGPTGQRCGGSRYSCKECYVEDHPQGSCTGPFKCSKAELAQTYPPC